LPIATFSLLLVAPCCTSALELVLGNASSLLTEGCGAANLGPVLGGVDIVSAYAAATAGARIDPPMGSSQYRWQNPEGFFFHFTSRENLDAYSASPKSFPLGAGGYCGLACSGHDDSCAAGSMCKGPACLSSPMTYEIATDGLLYFFFGGGGMKTFNYFDGTNKSQINMSSIASCAMAVIEAEHAQGHQCFNTDFYADCFGEDMYNFSMAQQSSPGAYRVPTHVLVPSGKQQQPQRTLAPEDIPEAAITDSET